MCGLTLQRHPIKGVIEWLAVWKAVGSDGSLAETNELDECLLTAGDSVR